MTYCQILAVKNLFCFQHLVPELVELKGFCVWVCPDVDPSSMGPRQGTPVFNLREIKRLSLCGRILPQESDFATLNILPTPLGLLFYSKFTEDLTVCLMISLHWYSIPKLLNSPSCFLVSLGLRYFQSCMPPPLPLPGFLNILCVCFLAPYLPKFVMFGNIFRSSRKLIFNWTKSTIIILSW